MLTLTSINVTSSITLVYGAQAGGVSSIELINISTVTTIYLGYDQTIQAGAGPAIPLGPGASIAFDGTRSVYAVVAAGMMAQLAVVPGGSNYSPGQMISPLFTSSGSTVIPGGSNTSIITLVNIGQYQSYDFTLQFVDALQNVAGHSLVLRIYMQWFDDLTSGLPVFQEIWNPWVQMDGNGGIVASGPMHGQYMSVSITNYTGYNVTMPYCRLFGSPRNVQLSDWRQSVNNSVNDAVLHEIPDFDTGFENSLADTGAGATLSPGTDYWLPFNLYSGPCYYSYRVTENVEAVAIGDVGTPQQQSGNLSETTGLLIGLPLAAGAYTGNLFLPRSSCALYVATSGSTTSLDFKLVAQQGP